MFLTYIARAFRYWPQPIMVVAGAAAAAAGLSSLDQIQNGKKQPSAGDSKLVTVDRETCMTSMMQFAA